MRNILLLITITLLFSCSGITDQSFEGEWANPEKPYNDTMTISKSGNNYIVETKKVGHLVGTINDGVLELSVKGQIVKAILDEDGNLIIGGNKLVRIE